MDLRQLEYFVRIAELGSFTRAAGVLDVAQPALSRQVRLLEVELRQSLLLRNGRGVTTTEAGKLLLEHARGILHQVERAREDLGRVGGRLAGRVAVGLPPTVARMMAVPLTREFRRRLPHAALSITEGLSVAMQERLIAGRLDIALLYNPTPSPEIELSPLREEELVLFCPMARDARAKTSSSMTPAEVAGRARLSPIALADVARLPLVTPSRPNAIRMLIETSMSAIGCRPTIALEIDGVEAILDLVSDGAGYAILPGYAVSASSRSGARDSLGAAAAPGTSGYRTRKIIKPRLKSRLEIAVSSQRATTLTQQAMLALISDVAQKVFSRQRTGAR